MARYFLIAFASLSLASAKEVPPPAITVGKPAPDFTVTKPDGGDLKLSDFRGKSHLVIVFGRAHW